MMRNPLEKRFPRDLRSNKGRYVAIALILIVMISVISGFLAVSDGVIKAFKENQAACKVEDGLFTTYQELDGSVISQLKDKGVVVYQNYYVNEEIKNETTLRIYKDREEIDLITAMEGKVPEKVDEIGIERLFAESNHIQIGDKITVNGMKLTVTGFLCAPDYNSLFPKNSDLMMDSFHFGIGIVNRDAFSKLPSGDIVYNYSYYFNDRNLSKQEKRDLSKVIKESLIENQVMLTNFCTAENNQCISFIEGDMGSDVPIMKVFLYIIIGIVAFVFSIVISSTVEAEAQIIGTLLASGYGKQELLSHYMAMPVAVTLFSALIGNLIGYIWMPEFFKRMYYGSYSLPPMTVELNMEALLITTVVPIMIMMVINFITLYRKLSISPLNFLRRELKKNKNRKAFKLPAISFIKRFRMRIIIQNMSGYITMFVGIFFASLLLMFGLCLSPMIDHYIDSIKQSVVADYQYILKTPTEADNEDSVKYAEKFTAATLETYYRPVKKNIEVSFMGIPGDSQYFKELNLGDDREGVYFSEGLAKKTGAVKGDSITFVNPYTNKNVKVKIIGTYDYPAGLMVFINQKELNKMLGYDEGYFNAYFSEEELLFADENTIASVITAKDMAKVGDQMLSSFSQLAPLCLTGAIVIYIVLMYILTKIVIDRNAFAISLLKVFGYKEKEVRMLYIRVTTIVVFMSLLLSIPLVNIGLKGSFQFAMTKVSGYLPAYISKPLYALMIVIGMGTYFILNFIHIRRINGIEMSAALKNRE